MKRPEITDVAAAIRCYYGAGYIGNKEIQQIFGKISSGTVSRLKKAVREEEIRQSIPEVVPKKVSSRIAYEVWQIDIDALVKNYKQLQKLGLV